MAACTWCGVLVSSELSQVSVASSEASSGYTWLMGLSISTRWDNINLTPLIYSLRPFTIFWFPAGVSRKDMASPIPHENNRKWKPSLPQKNAIFSLKFHLALHLLHFDAKNFVPHKYRVSQTQTGIFRERIRCGEEAKHILIQPWSIFTR